MFEVVIRVAGNVNPTWLAGGIPEFLAQPESPMTIIRGVLRPGEDMRVILGILGRHGLAPIDIWLDSFTTNP